MWILLATLIITTPLPEDYSHTSKYLSCWSDPENLVVECFEQNGKEVTVFCITETDLRFLKKVPYDEWRPDLEFPECRI